MSRQSLQRLILIVLVVSLQLINVLSVSACSPAEWRETTPAERAETADVVLVGTVIGSDNSDFYSANYAITVESYLKGTGPGGVLVTGFGFGGGDCLNRVQAGDRWLFYVNGNPQTDEVLSASYLQVYAAVDAATTENIAAISAHIGQAPIAPSDMFLWTQIKLWAYSPLLRFAAPIGVAVMVIASGLLFKLMNKRRKSRPKNAI